LSMMEFNATTTAFGADVPEKDANPWISRHRVSSNSMTSSLPDPSIQLTSLGVFWSPAISKTTSGPSTGGMLRALPVNARDYGQSNRRQ
jgi:hypothetical protein